MAARLYRCIFRHPAGTALAKSLFAETCGLAAWRSPLPRLNERPRRLHAFHRISPTVVAFPAYLDTYEITSREHTGHALTN